MLLGTPICNVHSMLGLAVWWLADASFMPRFVEHLYA